jgi:pyruvate dehydrogenase (quinone)/pyruvate oxidase
MEKYEDRSWSEMGQEQDLALAVVRQLAAWGVEVIFGVIGDDILPFLDAIRRDGRMRYIGAAHEAGASFMASNWAKLSGRLGVCVASAAGAVNLLQGLADAYLDGAPVLGITGQAPEAKIGTSIKQYFNHQRLYASFSVYSELVTDAPGALRLLIRAMAKALTEQKVAHLSFPQDIWSQPVQAEPGPIPALMKDRERHDISGDLERVEQLMNQSRHPLLVVGSQGRGAETAIRQLLNHWKAAVVVAQDAKGTVPDDWPEVIGGIGEGWTPGMVKQADCILLVGSAGYEENYLPKVATVQIRERLSRIDDIFLWDSVAGNIPQILARLTQSLEQYEPDLSWWEQTIGARQERIAQRENDLKNNAKPVHPAQLMAVLSEVASVDALSKDATARDTIIASDVGAFMHWFDRDFWASGQRILLSPVWRSMGSGLPAAIAAQIYAPESQVISLMGDGGLLMSLGELATVSKYRLPLCMVVVNNEGYGLERDKARAQGLNPVGLDIQSPDFRRCAEAFGIRGIRVEDPADLKANLTAALASREPVLVDVRCTKDARLSI